MISAFYHLAPRAFRWTLLILLEIRYLACRQAKKENVNESYKGVYMRKDLAHLTGYLSHRDLTDMENLSYFHIVEMLRWCFTTRKRKLFLL